MAKVTIPDKVVRHRSMQLNGKPGKWSKWHMVIRCDHAWELRPGKPLITHWTKCNCFYELGENWDGVQMVEVSTLDQVNAADVCGKCFYGLVVED